MKGSDWARSLPVDLAKSYGEYSNAVMTAVMNGQITATWHNVEIITKNAHAVFLCSDAVQIGEPSDSIRFVVSQSLGQKVADQLGCVLQSARVSDEKFKQSRYKLPVISLGVGVRPGAAEKMSLRDTMIAQNDRLNIHLARVSGLPVGSHLSGGIGNEGKTWINYYGEDTGFGLSMGINYGWYGPCETCTQPSESDYNLKVTNRPGSTHDLYHVDYSQLLYLVSRTVVVCRAPGGNGCRSGDDWETVDIYDLCRDPDVSSVWDNGVNMMGYARHPGLIPSEPPPWTGGHPQTVASTIQAPRVLVSGDRFPISIPPAQGGQTGASSGGAVFTGVNMMAGASGVALGYMLGSYLLKHKW